MTLGIVISYYKNLDFKALLDLYPFNTHYIYNKSGYDLPDIKTIHRPNIGVDVETIFNHIIENYDCLDDNILICQDDIKEHIPNLLYFKKHLDDCLKEQRPFNGFRTTWRIGKQPVVRTIINGSCKINSIIKELDIVKIVASKIGLELPNIYCSETCNLMLLSKTQILKRPKEFYITCLNVLMEKHNVDNQYINPYIYAFELLFGLIFTKDLNPIVYLPQPSYILYDVALREQLNKSLTTFYYMLEIAKQNNRVLVLPRIRTYPAGIEWLQNIDESLYTYTKFSDIFDLDKIKEYHHAIIELDDFKDNIDIILFVEPFKIKGRVIPCNKYNNNCGFFNGKIVKARESFYYNDKATGLPNCDKRVVAYSDVIHQIPFNQLHLLQSKDVLVYKQEWIDEADKWIKETYGMKPFIACHYRTGDFKIANSGAFFKDIHTVIKKINKVMLKYKMNRVFLCTDETNTKNLKKLKNAVDYDRYNNDDDLVKASILDVIIASKANAFLGTNGSNFTFQIIKNSKHTDIAFL